ncbi:MAG: AAA family ATPase [Paludibacteraceae bacterium]|nr:AAA family ATPase [Paludibacteraceae bacterium]
MSRLNEAQIYQWWDVMKGGNELVEIRLIGSNKTASGYFTNPKALIEAIRPYTNDFNVYFTINKIAPACYGREQRDKIMMRVKNTTSDHEIIARDYVLIDLDAKRLSGVCSTKEEAIKAYEKGQEVYKFLMDNGFYEPIVVFSSSGIHLYLRCALINNEENTKLVKRFLNSLSMLFSDEFVDCDTSVFNPARISRLIGSYSCKGANNDPTRPQRMCRFLKVPDEIKVNEREYFEKIAALYPEEEDIPTKNTNYSTERFDLEAFLDKYNIGVSKVENVAGGKKYILEHCVFNPQHREKDAVIFQRDTGAIAYHCFHASCSHYTWRDVRMHFDPQAYSRKDYREFQFKSRYYGMMQPVPYTPIEETEEKGKKWLTAKDIKRKREEDIVAIPTGFSYLDKAIRGLILGEVTILSGLNGSGKSSWLNTVMLNVMQRGFKVACFSGELTDYNVIKWLAQSAAGKNYVYKLEGSDYSYEVNDMAYDRIADWLNEKFYLFNNNYGNNFSQVISDLEEVVQKGAQFIVIDNLMALQISNFSGDKNERQKQFIMEVVEFAKKKNVHVVVVCHARKESGTQTLLRKESIAGSSDLTNAVQNVAIVHRCGEDFCKRASEFLGREKAEKYMEYDNVVEWCKSRSYGVVDYLVGMYYELETKRFKNSKAEHTIYGWEERPVQSVIFDGSGEFDIPVEDDVWSDVYNFEGDESPF